MIFSIVGLGMTGVAMALFLAKMGKKITIVDEKPERDLCLAQGPEGHSVHWLLRPP